MHPLDELQADEIRSAVDIVRRKLTDSVRFCSVSLHEPTKQELREYDSSDPTKTVPRRADVVVVVPSSGKAFEMEVLLTDGSIPRFEELPSGTQPPFTPDDCFLAEEIVKKDSEVRRLLTERYQIEDLAHLVCDPWSVHISTSDDPLLRLDCEDGKTLRLVQTFLYYREDEDDNQYAHPIEMLPVVDLNSEKVVTIQGMQETVPTVPKASVNYHRNKVASNSYLQKNWRSELLSQLDVVQPDGPSFDVDGSLVRWQKWSMRVTFNYREGLVLHDVQYEGRPILNRGSLVEMAVPYGDPHAPYQRKCAFDVGDYGLGYCANSLSLGCDCLGHIYYFDGTLCDSQGEPYVIKNAICMHEEDAGLLWKHMEYRNGHSESRRSRRLVLSSIATVVNYEYLFYWYFMQDGSFDYEIKLTGELSTNVLSEGETAPQSGVIVAPGVNAQIHQHMFCARLDMAVDGPRNAVSEVEFASGVGDEGEDPFGNAFRVVTTELRTEHEAQRMYAPGRVWKVSNPERINEITGKPVAYKLIPYSRGAAQPTLLTDKTSFVAQRGAFTTKNLWVTPYRPTERFPAGEYPTQGVGNTGGLSEWTSADRSVENEDIVLWHSFGVAHMPRIEDFPVMPCEVTGFTLKPDGFFLGNPGIDLAPSVHKASKLCAINGNGHSNGNGSSEVTTNGNGAAASTTCCSKTNGATHHNGK